MQPDDDYRRVNYRLCTSIDLCKLGIVLDEMVAGGSLHQDEAKAHLAIARGLLAVLRQANDRHHGQIPSAIV